MGHLARPDGAQGVGLRVRLGPQGHGVVAHDHGAVVLRQKVLLLQLLRLADEGLSGQLRQGQGITALQQTGFLCQTQPVAGLQSRTAAGHHAGGRQRLHGGGIFVRGDGINSRHRLRAGGHRAAGEHHDGGCAQRSQMLQIHGNYLPIVS